MDLSAELDLGFGEFLDGDAGGALGATGAGAGASKMPAISRA
ncbi:hypothetical protein [Kribbella alba]